MIKVDPSGTITKRLGGQSWSFLFSFFFNERKGLFYRQALWQTMTDHFHRAVHLWLLLQSAK